MATRNLYHVEDVAATLLYAIQTNQFLLSTQTFQELKDSEEGDLLHRLLTLAWILADPNHPRQAERATAFAASDSRALLGWLIVPEKGEKTLPPLPESFAAEPPPRILVGHEAPPPPSTWRIRPKGWTEAQTGVLWRAVQDTIRRKVWTRAAELCAPLLDGNTRSVASLLLAMGVPLPLTDLLETTIFAPLATRILQHAFAVLARHTSLADVSTPPTSLRTQSSPRAFALPIEALSLWRRPSRPLSNLLGSPTWVAEEDATQYWLQACARYGVTKQEEDLVCEDEEKEDPFYSTCFPKDIPDEWSEEERAKSHGIRITSLSPNPWVTAFVLCWS